MKTHENPWKPVKTRENPWKTVKTRENPFKKTPKPVRAPGSHGAYITHIFNVQQKFLSNIEFFCKFSQKKFGSKWSESNSEQQIFSKKRWAKQLRFFRENVTKFRRTKKNSREIPNSRVPRIAIVTPRTVVQVKYSNYFFEKKVVWWIFRCQEFLITPHS